jgi:co-chaperonin GroES (HSP10)
MATVKLRDIAVAAGVNPKQAILDSIGDRLDGVEVFHNLVLVGTYVAPEKTPGGIIRPDSALAEDRFQGKIGLVLRIGPGAFKDDKVAQFWGVSLKEYDWIWFRPGDGYEFFSVDATGKGTSCRVFEDTQIKGRVADPSVIW